MVAPVTCPVMFVPVNTLVIGYDPVSVDTVLVQIIDQLRQKHKLPPINLTDRPAKHIKTASTSLYNLGNYDEKLIEKVYIEV